MLITDVKTAFKIADVNAPSIRKNDLFDFLDRK